MPKKNRVAIYEYLFKEGVMVAKKDFHEPKHPDLQQIPNLEVIKALQVCTSSLVQLTSLFILYQFYYDFIFVISESEVPWLCERTVCMEALLLVSYK